MVAEKMAGLAVSKQVKADLAERVSKLAKSGVSVGLGTVLVGDDPGSKSYVSGKHRDCAEVGIKSIRIDLPSDTTKQELTKVLEELNHRSDCTGYIVQLPLPKQLDDNWALSQIDPDKDADGLHPINLGRLVLGVPAQLPCTPRGIVHLLRYYDVNLDGANVVIVGRGTTVGRPLGLLLTRKSENATVTICHTGTNDLASFTQRADIVIAAAGNPGMITANMIKPGAVLVDVGITRTENGLAGDLASDVWQIASKVAPVPGGIGPMTRAMLLTNVVEAAERKAENN